MNKKLTDYVIDLVEILNKQQKQVFFHAQINRGIAVRHGLRFHALRRVNDPG